MTQHSAYKAARAHLKEARPRQPAHVRSGGVSRDCCGGAKTNAVGTCSADAAAELPPLEPARVERWSCPEVARAGAKDVDGCSCAGGGAVDAASALAPKKFNGSASRRHGAQIKRCQTHKLIRRHAVRRWRVFSFWYDSLASSMVVCAPRQ